MSKINKYTDVGFDSFLQRNSISLSANIKTLMDIKSEYKSSIQQGSTTEGLSLGQSGSSVFSDGKTNRILIGKGSF